MKIFSPNRRPMDRSKRGKPRFPKTFVRDERGGAPERKPFVGGERGGAGERKPFVRGERGGAPERRPFVGGERGGAGERKPFARAERGGPPGRPAFARDDRRGSPDRRPFEGDARGGPPGRKPFVPDARGGKPERKPFVRGEHGRAPERKPFVGGERRGPGDYKRFNREDRAGAPARKPFVRTAWRGPEEREPLVPGEQREAAEQRPSVPAARREVPERRPFAQDARRGSQYTGRGSKYDARGSQYSGRESRSADRGSQSAGRGMQDAGQVAAVRRPIVKSERSGPGGGGGPVAARAGQADSLEDQAVIRAAKERVFPRPVKPRPGGAPPLHWRAAEMGKTRTGLARALSKLGYCSRNQAWELIVAGRVELNGVVVQDGEHPVVLEWDRIAVDGVPAVKQDKVYLALNKPRGLVTTASDEQGRPTVFECLGDFRVPHLSAVGRLDQASEGLLLFTNDHAWGAHLTSPERHVAKTYHVQVDRVVDGELAKKIQAGAESEGEHLAARKVSVLRHGEKTSWLEIILDEGRNRQIRRLLAAFELEVLRLVRVAIGDLLLGTLAKGAVRRLTVPEIQRLGPVPGAQPKRPPRARPTERQLRRRF